MFHRNLQISLDIFISTLLQPYSLSIAVNAQKKICKVFIFFCSFASLDRKGQSLKLRKQVPVTLQKQPTISTSLGNIEHISKLNIDNESVDNLSISSMNSDQKKFKEREW